MFTTQKLFGGNVCLTDQRNNLFAGFGASIFFQTLKWLLTMPTEFLFKKLLHGLFRPLNKNVPKTKKSQKVVKQYQASPTHNRKPALCNVITGSMLSKLTVFLVISRFGS